MVVDDEFGEEQFEVVAPNATTAASAVFPRSVANILSLPEGL